MENLMMIRLKLIEIYKEYEDIFNCIFKFIGGVIVFMCMSSLSMGAMGNAKRMGIVFIGGLIAAVASANAFIAFSLVCAVVFCITVSVEGAIVLFIALLLLYLMYGRIFPEESVLFIAMLVCFKFKVPYMIPIIGGVYFGTRAIFPTACAMFIYPMIPVFIEFCKMYPASGFDATAIMDSAFGIYTYFIENIGPLIQGSAFSAGVMVVVVLSAWGVSLLQIDYEKEIAILASSAVTVIGMFIAVVMGGSSFTVLGILISVMLSALILLALCVFEDVADYRKAERVRFQDKNYVYYVKAVPKIKAGRRGNGSED